MKNDFVLWDEIIKQRELIDLQSDKIQQYFYKQRSV